MSKVQVVTLLLAAALLAVTVEVSAQGQVRPNRLPGGQRGLKRPQFGLPQPGSNRPMNPTALRKQQLQQRVMQAIGLTDPQRMRIQEIRRSHEDDLIAAGRRIRQARQALDRAIMSENYDEAEVRRATETLAAAQSDKIRLDSNVRSKVRGVMTAEQVQRFHQLQRQMRRDMREEQQRQKDKETGPEGRSDDVRQVDNDLVVFLLSIFGTNSYQR